MDEKRRTEAQTREPPGLVLALRAADELVDGLLDLALAAAGADRAALLLIEDDGTLRCRAMRGDVADDQPPALTLDGTVREALEADDPVIVETGPSGCFPSEWDTALGARSAVLAPLHAPDGPLGLLGLGWDERDAGGPERVTAAKAAASIAGVLDAAITAEVERSRSMWRSTSLDLDREPIGRALAAIYLRSGLLRLGIAEDELANDAAEVERLSRLGLDALRRSEESLGDDGTISNELFEAIIDLTEHEAGQGHST
jgi:hypothetical protein